MPSLSVSDIPPRSVIFPPKMGNIHTVGPNEALIVSGEWSLLNFLSEASLARRGLKAKAPVNARFRRLLRLSVQEDSRGRVGVGLVARHRRAEALPRGEPWT